MSAEWTIGAECLVPGEARGEVALLTEALSLWGGFDLETGLVSDAHHPHHGTTISGRILVMPGGRGSSSSASILLESARLGVNPVAIVITDNDPILVIGALVSADLYGVSIPIVRIPPESLRKFESVTIASVSASPGKAYITPG